MWKAVSRVKFSYWVYKNFDGDRHPICVLREHIIFCLQAVYRIVMNQKFTARLQHA